MPTKPSKSKKHGKAFLDEAVAKSGYYKKPITKKRVIIAGLLAIPLGCTGIHDFLMQNKKRGFIHLLYSSVTFNMFFLPILYGIVNIYGCQHTETCNDMSSYDDTLNFLIISGFILFGASIIWGIVEAIILLAKRNHYPEDE